MGDGMADFFGFFPEELFLAETLSGVDSFCFFSWTPSEAALFGVFSLLCCAGAKVVFLGAIFRTVMERFTKAAAGAIFGALVWFVCKGLNRADRLLCGSSSLCISFIVS